MEQPANRKTLNIGPKKAIGEVADQLLGGLVTSKQTFMMPEKDRQVLQQRRQHFKEKELKMSPVSATRGSANRVNFYDKHVGRTEVMSAASDLFKSLNNNDIIS